MHESNVTPVPAQPISTINQTIQLLRRRVESIILGQPKAIEQVLAALLTGGHVLLEGKPGLGKTHLANTLARCIGGHSARIQFTPDLMPSDVTGFRLFDMKSQTFQMRLGPVFTHILLADEINRAPAKTQAALLEVMQEQQVTIDGETIRLEAPFLTLATQNPVEHEGTYPLPEAQLDRFALKVLIDYPEHTAECEIIRRASTAANHAATQEIHPVCQPSDIMAAQHATAAMHVAPEVIEYALAIAVATRRSRSISLGAGTRGAISLVRIAKGFAFLADRNYVLPDDIKKAALPVLRHRVQLTPEIAIRGTEVDEVLQSIIDEVPAPRQ